MLRNSSQCFLFLQRCSGEEKRLANFTGFTPATMTLTDEIQSSIINHNPAINGHGRRLCDRSKYTIAGSNCRTINLRVLRPSIPAVTAAPPFTALFNDRRGATANVASKPRAAE
jgi:hypothetical protein